MWPFFFVKEQLGGKEMRNYQEKLLESSPSNLYLYLLTPSILYL